MTPKFTFMQRVRVIGGTRPDLIGREFDITEIRLMYGMDTIQGRDGIHPHNGFVYESRFPSILARKTFVSFKEEDLELA